MIKKLLKIMFRYMHNFSYDDSFIVNYFQTIVLTIMKKAHASPYCLDYLHMLLSLFKSILYGNSIDSSSGISKQFADICGAATSE